MTTARAATPTRAAFSGRPPRRRDPAGTEGQRDAGQQREQRGRPAGKEYPGQGGITAVMLLRQHVDAHHADQCQAACRIDGGDALLGGGLRRLFAGLGYGGICGVEHGGPLRSSAGAGTTAEWNGTRCRNCCRNRTAGRGPRQRRHRSADFLAAGTAMDEHPDRGSHTHLAIFRKLLRYSGNAAAHTAILAEELEIEPGPAVQFGATMAPSGIRTGLRGPDTDPPRCQGKCTDAGIRIRAAQHESPHQAMFTDQLSSACLSALPGPSGCPGTTTATTNRICAGFTARKES